MGAVYLSVLSRCVVIKPVYAQFHYYPYDTILIQDSPPIMAVKTGTNWQVEIACIAPSLAVHFQRLRHCFLSPEGGIMHRYTVLVCTLALAACAAPTGSSPRPDASIINQEEIATTGSYNAYQLVERLRPAWFRTRGATSLSDMDQDIVVYYDGTRIGFRDELRTLVKDDIESIQYLSPARANTLFGQRHANGAIMVVSKRP